MDALVDFGRHDPSDLRRSRDGCAAPYSPEILVRFRRIEDAEKVLAQLDGATFQMGRSDHVESLRNRLRYATEEAKLWARHCVSG